MTLEKIWGQLRSLLCGNVFDKSLNKVGKRFYKLKQDFY